MAEDGIQQLFESLHPGLRWAGDRLVTDDRHDVDIDLRGRGLPLAPSVFATGYRFLTGHPTAPARVGAVYPARAVGILWERRGGDGGGLARLLGGSRARLLAYTSTPATTTQLAARTGLSAGAVSQHLAVLRAAGLVTSSRYRREVSYAATDLGMALLERGLTGAGRSGRRGTEPAYETRSCLSDRAGAIRPAARIDLAICM